MKAIAYLIDNFEELSEAQKLSLPKEVKPQYIEREFYFVLGAVAFAFLVEHEGLQKIKIFVAGQVMFLKYDEPTWVKITAHLINA